MLTNLFVTVWGEFPLDFEIPKFKVSDGMPDMRFTSGRKWAVWMQAELTRAKHYWEQGRESEFVVQKPDWYGEWLDGKA